MSIETIREEAYRLYKIHVLSGDVNARVLSAVEIVERCALYDPYLALVWRACLDRAANALNPIQQGPIDKA